MCEYLPKDIIEECVLPYLESNVKKATIKIELLSFGTGWYMDETSEVWVLMTVVEHVYYKDGSITGSPSMFHIDVLKDMIPGIREDLKKGFLDFHNWIIKEGKLFVYPDSLVEDGYINRKIPNIYKGYVYDITLEVLNIMMDNIDQPKVIKQKLKEIPGVKTGF